MSYTIDYLSEGGYQSHSVTLTCVDCNSYQSHLGMTTLWSTEKYLRVYPLGISPAFLRTKIETMDVKSHGAVDVKTKCGGRCVKRGIRA